MLRKSFVWFVGLWLIASVGLLSAQNITKPNITGPAGLQVNSYTGSLFYQRTDLLLPGRGLSLDFTFSYSNNFRNQDFGYGLGFTMPYNMHYVQDSIFTVIVHGDGRKDSFRPDGATSFISPTGFFDQLEAYEAGKLLLTSKEGMEYFFEDSTHMKLTRMVDRYGNSITLEYAEGYPSLITDASGRSVSLIWENNHLQEIRDENDSPGRTISYQYDGDGNLVTVTNFEGKATRYKYDAPGNLIDVIDPNGNIFNIIYNRNMAVDRLCSPLATQTFVYNIEHRTTYLVEEGASGKQTTAYQFDESGRVVKKTGNCCGYNVNYTYDEDNNIIQLIDANGQSWKFTYDARGNRLSESDPLGNTIRLAYEERYNLVTSITDKNGNATRFTYDEKGNLTQSDEPLGVTQRYGYNEFGNPISHTDGNGNTVLYGYDVHGNLVTVTDPIGGITRHGFDNRSNNTEITDPRGNKTTYAYDVMDRVIQITDALGNQTTYTYDANGNQLTVTDALQNAIRYAYDPLDRPVLVTDALGGQVVQEYDGQGNLIARTDQNGNRTAYIYDNLNRLASMTNAAGESTTYEYDGNGNLVTMGLPGGNILVNTFDSNNRMISTDDAVGPVASYEYDNQGNLMSETDANGNTTRYTHDLLYRIVAITNPLGNAESYQYDNNGNQTQIEDRKGNLTQTAYDALDRQLSMTDALGNVTNSEYDAVGNLVKITDAKGNATAYTYDALDRVTAETYADNTTIAYAYDAAGNIIARTDNKGNITNYELDALYRLTKRDYANSADDVFTYDATGRMNSATNANATLNFTYDPANRLLSESLNGKITGYAYEIASRRREISYPSGRKIMEQRDTRNRLATVSEGNTAIATWDYDPGNRKTALRYANGTLATYQYDNNNQLIALIQNPSGFLDYRYSYDKAGNRLSEEKRHRPEFSQAYAYDNINRLVDFTSGRLSGNAITNPFTKTSYTLDGVGNRVTVNTDGNAITYTANEMNEYASIAAEAGINWIHDDNGNLTSNGKFRFAYDDRDKLISVNEGDIAEYQYDPLGRRIRKITGGTVTEFFYDGDRVIEEQTGGDVTSFTYGSWIDDVLTMQREETAYYYHKNGLGSVTGLSDDLGVVQEFYEYDPYGAVTFYDLDYNELEASLLENPYLFTGRRLDTETGIYYYRNRHYDPEHGRFLQRDPLGYIDGMGLYEYVTSNPLSYIDPSGTNSIVLAPSNDRIRLDRLRTVKQISQAGRAASAISRVIPICIGLSVADGPFPIGEVASGVILIGAGIYDIVDILKNEQSKTEGEYSKTPPGETTKLKGNQGWEDSQGNRWKKDKKHKDHWDVTDPKTGKKVKEIDFDGKQIWPGGPKNKNKK